MQYSDFISTLGPLTQGKEINQAQAQINDTQTYDVHSSVLSSCNDFQICIMEGGWIAFVFKSKILVYLCGCFDQLLTPIHIQSVQN